MQNKCTVVFVSVEHLAAGCCSHAELDYLCLNANVVLNKLPDLFVLQIPHL